MTKPNILFIMTDQQSRHMMSCTGYPYVKTPAMDSIAESGVRFERAYCTNPVCVPSRFSLVTGRMPSEIKLQANGPVGLDEIPEDIKKTGLGWKLQEAGYKAVFAGKQHFPKMNAEDLGFENLTWNERDKLAQMTSDFVAEEHDKPWCLFASFINPHDICYMAIRDHADGDLQKGIMERATDEIIELDAALAKAEEIPADEFWEKHCPPLPPNFEPQEQEPEAINQLINKRSFRINARNNWDEKRWRLHRWAYAKLTERADGQIQKLLDSLRSGPYADNTVIFFTSDHGDHNSSHKLEHKTVPYEEAAGIPMLLSDPNGVSGQVDETNLVSNGLDVYPTICDYAGIEIPPHIKGRSLRPLVTGKPLEPARNAVPIECEIGNVVVSKDYKYMKCFDGEHSEQLYDLVNDEFHTKNFASEQEAVLQEQRKEFESLHPKHSVAEKNYKDSLN
jgi:arylsulfatase A-like enzyme